jgi:hypothetical protein
MVKKEEDLLRERFISSFKDKAKETEIYIKEKRPYQIYLK